jgi:hypothetical protein
VLSPVVAAGLVVIAAACGSAVKTAAAPKPSHSSAPTITATPTPQPVLWPLTGLPTSGSTNRPALAVKIENSIDARPQTGLNAADMVWEEVVEGGITRYVAVYQSTLPPTIGPVRSVRPMDPMIAGPLHGVLAFSGGQQKYISAAAHVGLQVLSNDAGDAGFYRTSSRPAPHNVYASPAKLLAQADSRHRAAPQPQFLFAGATEQPTAVAAGKPATSLSLTMSGVGHPRWTWSPTAGRWLRSEYTTPAVGADSKRLAATNVVVLRVKVVNTSALDPAGNPVPETLLAGTGGALVASGGHAVVATWAKPSVTAPVQLTGPDGAPVRLAPGNTWIELVPTGTGHVSVG